MAHSMVLVENGKPGAVVVLADDSTMTARYAAEELVAHVKKATGVELPVLAESMIGAETRPRIFVGMTNAARAAGIDAENLDHDAFILRSLNGDLFIVGREDPSRIRVKSGGMRDRILHGGYASREPTSPNGTLFGVYEILQRYVGVRWLWPGELGTYVPAADMLVIEDELDEHQSPKLKFRRLIWYQIQRAAHEAARGNYGPAIPELDFSPEVLVNYSRDLDVFLGRHRLGYSEAKPPVQHVFSGWWLKYGEDHPEWFMMRPDGQRGPHPNATEGEQRQVPICVTNTDLHRYIVEEYWDGGDYLSLGEADRNLACQCPDCLAWDVPQPTSFPESLRPAFVPQMTSNRYARFWKAIHDLASKRNPDVTITSFLYYSYLPAPTNGIDLGDRFVGDFAPWTGNVRDYPMPEEEDNWLREQWEGWRNTGLRMVYRPNIFHCGYVMPHLSTWQAGEFIRFAYEQGMEGFRQDSLFGNWAVRGPMLYMYVRLAWTPDMSIDAIRSEYFSAFGPAAADVEAYFDYWEEYSARRPGGDLYMTRLLHTHLAYPQEIFGPAEELLQKAFEAAQESPDPQYADRVLFLKLGLEHARLAARLFETLDSSGTPPVDDPERFQEAQNALWDLIYFRRAHESDYIADLRYAAGVENRWIDIPTLMKNFNEVALPESIPSPWIEWTFRPDPEDVGMFQEWYKGTAGQAWEPIRVPGFWQDDGFENYLGYGWYRTEFIVPEDYGGRPLQLLFEGVDEQAWIFINGKMVGEHTESSERLSVAELWNRPFAILVDPEYLFPGQENRLVVRVHASENLAGIHRPVRLATDNQIPDHD